MNPIPGDELLSAYLDGELPADERKRVERLLAEQPESRQLLDELAALRGTLEAVPRYRLEVDFAERVLRAAERTMLSRDTAPSAMGEGDATEANGRSIEAGKPEPASLRQAAWSSPDAGSSSRGAEWSWQRARRPLTWAGLALAAGLLMMITQPDRPGGPRGRDVAVVPRNAEIGAANRDDTALRRAPEQSRVDQELESVVGQAETPTPNAADREHQADEPVPAPSGLGSPLSAPATESQSPDSAGGGGMPAGGKAHEPRNRFGGGASPAPPRGEAGDMPGRGVRMAGPEQKELTKQESQRNADSLAPADGSQRLAEVLAADDTLLIVCDVAFDLVDRPEFQQLLAKHDIILEQASDEWLKSVKESTVPSRSEEFAASPTDEKATEKYHDHVSEMRQQHRREFGLASDGSREAAFDALYGTLDGGVAEGLLVEATEEQLEAVVADFEQHSELFLSIAVDPAPDVPEQQALTAFNRSRAVEKPPAGPPADDSTPDSPIPPAPAPAKAPNGDVEDNSEPKDRPTAAPAAVSEPTSDAVDAVSAAPVQGRAMRLETLKSAMLTETADQDVKRKAARTAKAGAQRRLKEKTAEAAANDDALLPKPATLDDQGDKSKPTEVLGGAKKLGDKKLSDKKLSDKGKTSEDGQLDEARRATKNASARRRALFIFRHVAPDAIESAPADDP